MNKIKNIKISCSYGLTITELMVDLVLSALVISSALGLYVNYKRSFNYQTNIVFLYQNAKTAYDYLNDDLQLSGFYGCDSTPSTVQYAITPGFDYDFSNPTTANEANSTGFNSNFSLASPTAGWTPALQGQMTTVSSPNPGSDVLTLRFADTNPLGVLSADTIGSSLSSVGIQNNIKVGDQLLISDCRRTVIFQVGSLSTDTLVPTASVGSLNSGAEIYKLNVNSYYVKTANNIPSLYRLRNGTEEILVPYVENLQIIYGQDTNGDGIADDYNTGDMLSTAPIEVIGISMMMRSIDKHTISPSTTTFKMFTAPPALQMTSTINVTNDKYVRKIFDFNLNFPNTGGDV
ncbi:MAG: PilW family protein [Gammaproteobacteria bacterium]|nr:PilW family protein [Gammaproteobacteria bacterium]